jgi:hypothetical protein
MATVSMQKEDGRPRRSLTWLLWQEALLSWGIPLLLIGAMAVMATLGFFDLIGQIVGVAVLGWLLLLVVAFFTFRAALTGVPQSKLKTWTVGLSLVWIILTVFQFSYTIFARQRIATETVGPETTATLALEGGGAAYDLVVEGTFVPMAGETARQAGYQLVLEKDGTSIQTLTGTFSEQWVRQRLGRRGSTRSLQVHNHVLHHLQNGAGGTYRLKLVSLDPQLQPSLQISLYRNTYPQKTFWLLDAFLLLGAYLLETLVAAQEVPLLLITATILAFLMTFQNNEIPPPSYRHLIGAALIAVIAGPLGGWGFRLVANSVRRGLSRLRRRSSR